GPGLRLAVAAPMDQKAFVDKYGFNASLLWWWFEDQAKTWGWPPPLMIEPPNKDLRTDVKLQSDLGLRPFPYMAYMGIGAPNWISDQFANEWRRVPLSTQPAEPPRGHYFLDVCGNAVGFGDYLAAGTKWLLDDIGCDGCYTDGNGHVYPCQNTHHGCGYHDEAGVLRPTWPIFGSREYLKRMYKLIHAKRSDGILVNHVSYDTFIPTQSFTDIYYTGEHEQYEDLVKNRVRWQGKQWGFWVTTLGPDSHSYEPMHVTYGLLHGVSVWPQGWQGRNDMLRKTANLWQAYDRFGYRDAQWIPYYRAETGLAKPDRERVKASLYLKQGQRALLLIGNLDPEVVEAKVALDLKKMGLSGKARNALTDRPLTLTGNQLTVRLRPHSMVLAWVE
ncbi:MAG: hypothetical protein KKI08_21315, partial [Armatimonadetes bacterium]|nr:hypothetical protein [Armatimonadota bacterium]